MIVQYTVSTPIIADNSYHCTFLMHWDSHHTTNPVQFSYSHCHLIPALMGLDLPLLALMGNPCPASVQPGLLLWSMYSSVRFLVCIHGQNKQTSMLIGLAEPQFPGLWIFRVGHSTLTGLAKTTASRWLELLPGPPMLKRLTVPPAYEYPPKGGPSSSKHQML